MFLSPVCVYTRDNLEIKKVEISMKNPLTYRIMRFSSINPKITIFQKNSSVLIVLMCMSAINTINSLNRRRE